jgi:hypothetical protein
MSSWPAPQPDRSWWRPTPPLTSGREPRSIRAAPPASRLLRIACADGLRSALTRETSAPPSRRKPRARPRAFPRPARDTRPRFATGHGDHRKGHLQAALQRPVEPAISSIFRRILTLAVTGC